VRPFYPRFGGFDGWRGIEDEIHFNTGLGRADGNAHVGSRIANDRESGVGLRRNVWQQGDHLAQGFAAAKKEVGIMGQPVVKIGAGQGRATAQAGRDPLLTCLHDA
jgi:hypothetical protein